VVFPNSLTDREKHKFVETTKGETAVRTITEYSAADSDTTVTIYNIPLGPVDTEQSQALPANTKSFLIKTRGNAQLKLAYTSGDSGTTFITIGRNAVYEDPNFYSSLTLYFQSPATGDTVEIIAYS
jgi:hypothetical protein